MFGFGTNKSPAEQVLAGMKTRTPEEQRNYDEYIRATKEAGQGDAVPVPAGVNPYKIMPLVMPTAPKRPGDTPPKAYVGIARDILNKAMDSHTDELMKLDADIAKLTEERRQVRIAIDGMQAALTHMSAVDVEHQCELALEETLGRTDKP